MTDDEIISLISMPKHIVSAERKAAKLKNRSSRNSFKVEAEHESRIYRFTMFLRQSDSFIEDFSVGLMWDNAVEFTGINKSMILLRCQGPHDGKQAEGYDIHHSFHMHILTATDMAEKRYTHPSNRELTDRYNSFESAIQYFIERCNIQNADAYFEPYEQLSFDI